MRNQNVDFIVFTLFIVIGCIMLLAGFLELIGYCLHVGWNLVN